MAYLVRALIVGGVAYWLGTVLTHAYGEFGVWIERIQP